MRTMTRPAALVAFSAAPIVLAVTGAAKLTVSTYKFQK